MKNKMRNAGLWRCLIALAVTAGLFIFFGALTDFTYLTNDDMYLQAIVSGEISGAADAHMIYSNYILGCVLSGLYRFVPGMPWYGLYLTGVLFLCCFLVLIRILERAEGRISKIAGVILFGTLVSMGLFRHIAMLQYTVTAAMAGATACFYALTMEINGERNGKYRDFLLIFLLAGLCFLIRDKVFFMLVPFAGLGWLGKWALQPKKTKPIHLFFAALLLGMGILVLLFDGIDFQAYRICGQDGDAWQEFLAYNKNREQLYDYYGFPDYQENRELYDSMGIGEASYQAAAFHYLILPQRDKFNAQNMEELAKQARMEYQENMTLALRCKEAARAFVHRNLDYTDRPLNIIVYACWLCLFLFLIVLRSRGLFWQMLLLFAARMLVWGIIFWQGRYPDRITQSLYLTELLLLAALYLQEVRGKLVFQKSLFRKCFSVLILLLLCVPAVYFGIPKMRAVIGENAGKLFFSTSYGQLKEYCMENDENLYLADMNSLSSFQTAALKKEQGICRNLLPLGSWLPGSPLAEAALKRYGIVEEQDFYQSRNVYFVFRDSAVTEPAYLEAFYKEFPGISEIRCVKVDSLQTDAGIDFGIYRLEVQ